MDPYFRSLGDHKGPVDRAPPTLIRGCSASEGLTWAADPDPVLTVIHAVPHRIISQLLRPEVAFFFPPDKINVRSVNDARCCVSSMKVAAPSDTPTPEAERGRVEPLRLNASTEEGMAEFITDKFPHLSRLDLSDTNIDGDFITRVSAIRSLQQLSVSGCDHLEDADCDPLENLTELEHLDLSCCDKLSAAVFAHLGKLTALKTLDLSFFSGPITAVDFAPTTQLSALQHLNLSFCTDVEADAFSHLVALPHLKGLNLHNTILAEGTFHFIGKLVHLCFLDLSDCSSVNSEALAELEMLQDLRELDLSHCEHVDATGLSSVSTMLNLRSLALRFCSVDCDGLGHLGKLGALEYLNLDSGYDGEGNGLVHLPLSLRHLNLENCYDINADGFTVIGELPRLHTLKLNYCMHVNGAALATFATKLPELTSLDVSNCPGVSRVGLQTIARLSRLRTLGIRDCGKMDATALELLRASVPNLITE